MKVTLSLYRPLLIAVLVSANSVSCIQTFDVNYDLDTSAVVVTGLITDQAPAMVELREPASNRVISVSSIPRISGAMVVLEDNYGVQEELVEVQDGFYQGQSKGVPGRAYSIQVTLPGGLQVTSSPQLLKPSPSIDSLYLEQVSSRKQVNTGVEVDVRGVNLMLSLERTDTLSTYYRWTTGGTYIFYSAFDFERAQGACYYTIPVSPSFSVGESTSTEADIITKRLAFISPNSSYFYGHSVLVSQYSQTKEAYDYWKQIEDQQNNVGSIFDAPPSQLQGNVNVTAGEGLALGFFEAAAVKTRRIFINGSSFTELDPNVSYFSDLGVNEPCFPPDEWPVPFIPPDFCYDCALLENSSRTKPPFWP